MEFSDNSLKSVLDGAGLAPQFRNMLENDQVVELPSCAGSEQLRPFVLRNQPAILRGVLRDWPPVHRWSDDEHLLAAGEGRQVEVRCVENDCETFGDPTRQGVYSCQTLAWSAFLQALDAAERHQNVPQFYAAQVTRVEGRLDIILSPSS